MMISYHMILFLYNMIYILPIHYVNYDSFSYIFFFCLCNGLIRFRFGKISLVS